MTYVGFKPFKGREIDESKTVQVYRNLHKGGFSVRQGGLVVGHIEEITLHVAKFKVSEAGRDRVRRDRVKNVHAYVEGVVFTDKSTDVKPGAIIYYNPMTTDYFTNVDTGEHTHMTAYAVLKDDKVYEGNVEEETK